MRKTGPSFFVRFFFLIRRKGTNEEVCLEVVERVEVQAVARPKSEELKISLDAATTPPSPQKGTNNAGLLMDAHAIILVYDPCKEWTYEWVKTQLLQLTNDRKRTVDILVLANFRDMNSKWQVKPESAREAFKSFANVHFLECCAKDGFGKSQILTFFNLPFLRLQRQHFEKLLAQNREETDLACQEFEMISFEQNYEAHLKWATEGPAAVSPSSASRSAGTVPPPVSTHTPPRAKGAAAPVVSPPKAKPSTPAPAIMANLPLDEDLVCGSVSLSGVKAYFFFFFFKDGFLVASGADDGWGKTEKSSDDESSSENELVAAAKLPTAEQGGNKVAATQAVRGLSPVVVVTAVAEGRSDSDGLEDDDFSDKPPIGQISSATVSVNVTSTPTRTAETRREIVEAKAAPAVFVEEDEEDLDGFLESNVEPPAVVEAAVAVPPPSVPAVARVAPPSVPVTKHVPASTAPPKADPQALAAVLEAARLMAEEQAKQGAAPVEVKVKAAKKGKKKTATKKKPQETAVARPRGDYTSL